MLDMKNAIGTHMNAHMCVCVLACHRAVQVWLDVPAPSE